MKGLLAKTIMGAAFGAVPFFAYAHHTGAHENLPSYSEDRTIVVKTNALLWGIGIMNLGMECSLSDRISLSLPAAWCPWFLSDKFAVRTLAISPEARWWLTRKMEGHFLGVHGMVSWYNVKFGRNRYQDRNRPASGGGISYGYALTLSGNWGLEFSLGAGVVQTKYDVFGNYGKGIRKDTRKTLYFGPDHIGVSLTYLLAP